MVHFRPQLRFFQMVVVSVSLVASSTGLPSVYQTDYVNTECYADAETRVVFASGHVTRVVFYNGD